MKVVTTAEPKVVRTVVRTAPQRVEHLAAYLAQCWAGSKAATKAAKWVDLLEHWKADSKAATTVGRRAAKTVGSTAGLKGRCSVDRLAALTAALMVSQRAAW